MERSDLGRTLSGAVRLQLRRRHWLRDFAVNVGRPRHEFLCNICGHETSWTRRTMGRETPTCWRCGSTVRARTLVDALARTLWGRSCALSELGPLDLSGLGFSESPGYALPLSEITSFDNSFFHVEPRRDLLNIASFMERRYDFIVCSEVLEHVGHPLQRAFDNLYALLKPGGHLFVSVPMIQGETKEHYPELKRWAVARQNKVWELRGETPDGDLFASQNVIFHGGEGSTVEMRVFGRADFESRLNAAGFDGFHEFRGHNERFGCISEGTPEFVDLPGGRAHGLHSGVYVASKLSS